MYKNLDNLFFNLDKSKFRSSFHLNDNLKKYVKEKGMDTIKSHACDFVNKKLKSAFPYNDGKQTAYKGHPVFVAQHATGTCCRGCLEKWHHILKGKELTDIEVNYIVSVIMRWIENEMKISFKK